MTADFALSGPIAAGIAGSFMIPIFLALSGLTGSRPLMGLRFRLAILAGFVTWLGLLFVWGEWAISDLIAGALIFAGAVLVSFNVWGLLAWGFMLSMLLALHRAGRPLSQAEWIREHAGGTISVFAENRLAVLRKAGLVHPQGEVVVVGRGMGEVIARLLVLVDAWFLVRGR